MLQAGTDTMALIFVYLFNTILEIGMSFIGNLLKSFRIAATGIFKVL